ncbi:hypothetical protein HW555_009993 [Spodoptera exigua]|uniref:Uncharacterized protein n=1 Tax=Spodoptera exigua TaxID=7107 RepID=A0A835L1B4_SPOEX|nr:hypothetical protein HW555_009993 [Spodoptera exigua]
MMIFVLFSSSRPPLNIALKLNRCTTIIIVKNYSTCWPTQSDKVGQYNRFNSSSASAKIIQECVSSSTEHAGSRCTNLPSSASKSTNTEVLSAQKSLEECFIKKMNALEAQIQTAGPAKDTVAKVAEEFRAFRDLVIGMLGLLRRQIDECSRQLNDIETRSRRKALIIQDITEAPSEDCANVALGVMNTKLGLNFSRDSIKVYHRLGQANTDHHRPILVRFTSMEARKSVWRAKTSLRGSKIAVKEFLTKTRQSVFGTARQHFGMRSCWTQEGTIFIKAPDGSRHKLTSLDELNPLLSKYPKAHGSSVGKRSPESVGENLKGTRK